MPSRDICGVSECRERTSDTSDHFCCCYSDLCNKNFTKAIAPRRDGDQINTKKRLDPWGNNERTHIEPSWNGTNNCEGRLYIKKSPIFYKM